MKQDAPEASNRVGEVHVARDANALAAVQALELGEELDVALHEVGELVEEACALLGTGVEAPGRLEGLARRGDGGVDVGLLGVCDGGDGLAVGRVKDLERGRVGGVALLREEGGKWGSARSSLSTQAVDGRTHSLSRKIPVGTATPLPLSWIVVEVGMVERDLVESN